MGLVVKTINKLRGCCRYLWHDDERSEPSTFRGAAAMQCTAFLHFIAEVRAPRATTLRSLAACFLPCLPTWS